MHSIVNNVKITIMERSCTLYRTMSKLQSNVNVHRIEQYKNYNEKKCMYCTSYRIMLKLQLTVCLHRIPVAQFKKTLMRLCVLYKKCPDYNKMFMYIVRKML